MIKARVHSIESFATFEGRGIRYAIFLQGCPYRCVYCHNPDSWSISGGTIMDLEPILKQIYRFRNFYNNGGGVTVTGGEPLLQGEFIEALFRYVKEIGLTTTIDTSGAVIPRNIDKILENTDLAIVDLKFTSNEDYKKYANGNLDNTLELLNILNRHKVEVWLRTVIIPDINDNVESLDKYLEIARKYECISEYQLLGYHTMGVYKYEQSGIPYLLKNTEAMSADKLLKLQKYVNKKFNK